jgi:flavodoxin
MKTLKQIQMFEKVNENLERNLTKWDTVVAFHSSYDKFVKNLVKLKKLKQIQPKNQQKIVPEKNKQLTLLIKSVVPVANALEVYGTDHNRKLSKQVKINAIKLVKSSDSEILRKCELVLTKGRKLLARSLKNAGKKKLPVKPSIIDYGLAEKMLTKLEQNIDKYRKETEELKAVIRIEKNNSVKMRDLIDKNDKLLTEKLDKLMALFESTDRKFYDSYFEARGTEKSEIKINKAKQKQEIIKAKKGMQKRDQRIVTDQLVSI